MPTSGESADDVLHAFERWPTWMWANREVVELAEWLREHNRGSRERATGRLLRARRLLALGLDARGDGVSRARRSRARGRRRVAPTTASSRTPKTCRSTRARRRSCRRRARTKRSRCCARFARTRRSFARTAAKATSTPSRTRSSRRNAELYYRTMVRGGPASWNVRDRHMVETLERLMQHHGPHAKAIVWEHNTHIGDARFTDMARAGHGERRPARAQAHERDGVVLVGFGTHRGTVIAADEWGAPMERMRVPVARAGQLRGGDARRGCRRLAVAVRRIDDGGVRGLEEPIGHRAIGVVYDPEHERWGNYVRRSCRGATTRSSTSRRRGGRSAAYAGARGRRAAGDVSELGSNRLRAGWVCADGYESRRGCVRPGWRLQFVRL